MMKVFACVFDAAAISNVRMVGSTSRVLGSMGTRIMSAARHQSSMPFFSTPAVSTIWKSQDSA